MFLHVSVILSTEGVVSKHALQVSRPTPRGKLRGLAWRGFQGPHPGGKLRGLPGGGLQGPHPRGEVEGSGLGRISRPPPGGILRGLAWGGLQAHTQGSLHSHTQVRGSPGSHPVAAATAQARPSKVYLW